MSKDLYDIVGDKIIEFCEKTYFSDIVCSFEQSYDGKEWTKEVEFATFYSGTNLCYESDWNEGQTHLRNLRIWHLDDSEPVVRCKDCKWAVCTIGGKLKYCKKHDPMCINKLYYDTDFFCRDGERREDG